MTRRITKSEEEPFSKEILVFIDSYVHLLDVKKAAIQAKMTPEEGKKLYKNAAIRAEIDRRMEDVNHETAKLVAQKRVVNVEDLDAALMAVVRIPVTTLRETPTLAASKMKAIELGYQRTGILVDNNFIPEAGTGPTPDEAPRIYRATERTILTHQVETTQTVTHREVVAPAPPDSEVYAY